MESMRTTPYTAATPRPGRNRGFTLVELIIVMILLAVIAAVAAPRVTGGLFSSGPQLSRYQNELIGDLRRARVVAMACGERRAFEVDLAPAGSPAWMMDTGDEPCQGQRPGPDLPTGFELEATPVTTFVFRYPDGDIGEVGADERLSDDLAITLTGDDGRSRNVCVRSLTGVVERGAC